MVEAVKQSIEYIESSDAIRKRVRKIVLPNVAMFANFLNLTIKYWYIPTISIIAIVSVVVAYFSTPKGKYQWDMFKYKMPIFRKTYIFIRLYKTYTFITFEYNKWCKNTRSFRSIKKCC